MASAANAILPKGTRLVAAVLALAAALYLLARSRGCPSAPDLDAMLEARPVPELADMDYDWSVRGLDGQALRIEDMRGKVLFLNVWATWCPPCREELPGIQRLHDKVEGEGVAFVLVSTESPAVVGDFVGAQPLHVPVYTAVGQLPAVLATDAIPATFIVSPRGKVVLKYVGSADWDRPVVVDFLRRVKEQAG
jgi:thiol-disulfide isomerase/thioredoxin